MKAFWGVIKFWRDVIVEPLEKISNLAKSLLVEVYDESTPKGSLKLEWILTILALWKSVKSQLRKRQLGHK